MSYRRVSAPSLVSTPPPLRVVEVFTFGACDRDCIWSFELHVVWPAFCCASSCLSPPAHRRRTVLSSFCLTLPHRVAALRRCFHRFYTTSARSRSRFFVPFSHDRHAGRPPLSSPLVARLGPSTDRRPSAAALSARTRVIPSPSPRRDGIITTPPWCTQR